MSTPEGEEITTVFRVMKTCYEMLKDRGYEVEDSEINMTRKEFIDKHNGTIRREELAFTKSKPNNTEPVSLLILRYIFQFSKMEMMNVFGI